MFSITKMKTERLEYFNQQSRVCKEQKQIQLICRFFANQIVVHSSEKLECQKKLLKCPLKWLLKFSQNVYELRQLTKYTNVCHNVTVLILNILKSNLTAHEQATQFLH